MRLSLLYELQRPQGVADYDSRVVQEAIEQIVLADQAGFSTVWMTEHHFLTTFCNSPAQDLVLAAVAPQTKNIRLGLGAVILPYHHPVHVAERVALLDILSNGRVEFGTGRGGPYEQIGNGIDPREGRARWDESLRIITGIWKSEGEFSYDGTFWSVPPRYVLPRPVQQPHPPIWVACTSKETFGLAAERGLGILEFDSHPPASLAGDLVDYRNALAAAAPLGAVKTNQWASCVAGFCGRDDGVARENALNSAKAFFGPGRPYSAASASLFKALVEQWGDSAPADLKLQIDRARRGRDLTGSNDGTIVKSIWERFTADDLCRSGTIVGGNPESCLAALEQHHRIGADEVMLIMQTDAVSHEQVMSSIELLGKEVIPELQRWETVTVGAPR